MAKGMPLRKGVRFSALSAGSTLVAQCCVCGLLRARKSLAEEPDQWITSRAYEHMYGVTLSGSRLTHTYCSGCYGDFIQRVRPSQHTVAVSSY